MDLRQIEYAVAIVDHGGFTKAAAALYVAQPSLSQSIKRLEADLGAPLFVRRGRGVRLSPAGHAFLGPARRLLRDASTVRDTIAAHTSLATGTLDVVALPTLVADPLAGFIGKFRGLHPGVTVRVAEPGTARDLIEMVRDGRCEVGLTESVDPVDGLVQMRLGRQRLLAVLPPGLGEDASKRLDLADLADQSLILTPPGTSTRDLVESALATVGAQTRIAVETNQREAIVPLVLAGAGSTVLPEPLALDARSRGATVRPLRPALSRTLGLIHPAEDLSPAAAAFIAVVALASSPSRRPPSTIKGRKSLPRTASDLDG